jgi:hypothetical protein
MEDEDFELITELVDNYVNWELNSDYDEINLIEDLKLSNNIHETAHSRILYKLLSAGKSDKRPYWRDFIKIVGFNQLANIEQAVFYREKLNIDLLVILENEKKEKYAVILENKINHAVDQDRQISSYIEKIEKSSGEFKIGRDKIYVIYLTRNEIDLDPSDDSLSKKDREDLTKAGRYKKISYENEIRRWIKKCLKDCKKPVLKSVFIQYGNFLDIMFEPENNRRRKDMADNISDWLGFDEIKTTENKYNKISSKIDSINSLTKDLEDAQVDLVKEALKNIGIKNITYDPKVYKYIDFSIKITINGNDVDLKCKFCFRSGSDGYKVWFGICCKRMDDNNAKPNKEIAKEVPLIKWDGNEIVPNDSNDLNKIIINAITANDENKLLDSDPGNGYNFENKEYIYVKNEPYFCWKYSENLDKAIDEIKDYVTKIQEAANKTPSLNPESEPANLQNQ